MAMKSNEELLRRTPGGLWTTVPALPPLPTEYGIVNTAGLWAGEHFHWVMEQEQAKRFSFMISAEAYGVLSLGLSLDQFKVEAV